MLDRFLKEGLVGKSKLTIKTYDHALRQFSMWLEGAGATIERFSRTDVQQYIDYMASRKKSAATINKTFNAIKKYCKWLKKTDCTHEIHVVKAPDYTKMAPKALNRIVRNQLIRSVDRTGNKRDYAIIITLVYTGLRVSELVALDRSDVEISERKGTLRVRAGKGNKERVLPLDVEARRAIEKYIETRSDDHEALFLSNRDKRISIRSVQYLLEKMGHHPHELRHTFITGLVRANQDISVIQSLTGHTTADMVLRYSRPTEEDMERAVEQLYRD